MTNLPLNTTAESSHRLFAGVDVGADERVLVIRSGRGDGIAPVTSPTPPDMRFSASGG